jgi:hypothetical protein
MLRFFRITLIVLGILVLLGQVWPAGAPPFARSVNILFVVGVLLYLVRDTVRRR